MIRRVGSLLFYARSIDSTFLAGLNTIAMQQTSATDNTLKRAEDLLDYAATHPNAKVRYRASDMVLQIHTDASYLSEPKARSRAAGHYFLGWLPHDNQPIRLNGSIYTSGVLMGSHLGILGRGSIVHQSFAV